MTARMQVSLVPKAALSADDRATYEALTAVAKLTRAEALRALGRPDLIPGTVATVHFAGEAGLGARMAAQAAADRKRQRRLWGGRG